MIKRLLKAAALNTLRRSLRYLFFILVLSQVLICGLGLTLYSLFQLLPIAEEFRLYWMLGTGLAMVLVPLLLIARGTSKRTWSI